VPSTLLACVTATSRVDLAVRSPNGIGLSPDGKTLYVAETESARLWAWDLSGPGQLAKPAAASPSSPHGSRLVYGSSVYQRFDSLAVEAGGNICVATLDRGGVSVIDAKTGGAEFVPVPGDTHCTNLCFGGPDLRTAYITSSGLGLLYKTDWPRPGLPLAY